MFGSFTKISDKEKRQQSKGIERRIIEGVTNEWFCSEEKQLTIGHWVKACILKNMQ